MTLVLTEITDLGIAMSADSAVTEVASIGGTPYRRVLTGAVKLQPIPYLNAGISIWGEAIVPAGTARIPADMWLHDFVRRHSAVGSLEEFAKQLEAELRRSFGKRPGDTARLGFHLVGYTPTVEGPLPDFWHIHDGPSQIAPSIDPTEFNACHDHPPERFSRGREYLTHNGDYKFYHLFLKNIQGAYKEAASRLGFPLPPSRCRGAQLTCAGRRVLSVTSTEWLE